MFGPTRWQGKATAGFVHVDEFGPLETSGGTFSANMYLILPPNNDDDKTQSMRPALQIWPLSIPVNEWEALAPRLRHLLSAQDAAGQVELRAALGDPVEVCAEPGDLVLFCVQRPHCAVGFGGEGIRVSLQCFLNFEGSERRIEIDS
mmetsp:Transcript_36805/g.85963  ORF Transcript_36805/g.85963 Transcript_36805/m.85963 type:complete len:147 (-) Transcript_36805:352-792(-)